MTSTGAPTPRRAGLARIPEATSRFVSTVREQRRWARERHAALSTFHDELELRPGASMTDVLDAIAEARGRQVEPLMLSDLSPHITGMAVPGEDRDYIGLSTRLSRRHRALVLLHEVRHLLPSTATTTADDGTPIALHSHFDGVTVQTLTEQLSALPPKVREEILNRPAKLRAAYDTDEERTCEVFARVVLPLLDLDPTSQRTGRLVSGFANRRSI